MILFYYNKMVYDKEDLQSDECWLRGMGVDTEEVTDFLIGLIGRGFEMTRKEYKDFIESVK